jgi:hypothetical protein
MMLKHLLLGSGFISKSFSALLMMVDMAPRKKRALVGLTAPGWLKADSRALRSCNNKAPTAAAAAAAAVSVGLCL